MVSTILKFLAGGRPGHIPLCASHTTICIMRLITPPPQECNLGKECKCLYRTWHIAGAQLMWVGWMMLVFVQFKMYLNHWFRDPCVFFKASLHAWIAILFLPKNTNPLPYTIKIISEVLKIPKDFPEKFWWLLFNPVKSEFQTPMAFVSILFSKYSCFPDSKFLIFDINSLQIGFNIYILFSRFSFYVHITWLS